MMKLFSIINLAGDGYLLYPWNIVARVGTYDCQNAKLENDAR